MKVAKEIKKAEAVKRMKVLKLFKPCINALIKRDEVQLSEMTGMLYEFSDNAELNQTIKEFEEKHNAYVYHVIHTYTEFGELYNFCYVSDYADEWETDNDDIKDNYVFCYTWNKDYPCFSELGIIAVNQKYGGLVRIS